MHLLSAAIQAYEAGYSLIPVGKEKKPTIKWQQYQKERAPVETIEAWCEQYPNIGIVTGRISGITVVDIDVKHTEKTPLDAFPETYTVQTPSGGYHLYYQYSDAVYTGSNLYEKYPHVDIRNDGGYVVAPPSEEGKYRVIKDIPLTKFPKQLFKNKKSTRIKDTVGITSGSRNSSITSAIGGLLHFYPETRWSDAWVVTQSINKTYKPPLSDEELRATFDSIASAERSKRAQNTISPIQATNSEMVGIRLRRNPKTESVHRDLANAMFVLENHERFAGKLWYDSFTKNLMFGTQPITDDQTLEIQRFMQVELPLSNIPRKVIEDALVAVSRRNEKSSALEYIKSLAWDGIPRVDTWLIHTYGVEDNEYHRSVGSNWLRAMVGRIARPGMRYDHVLVIEGEQGTRKTTSFATLGGNWHVETTIHADSKDFLMQFTGKAIVEFSEGETLSRSETKLLKALITRTVDKYRPPYGRVDEEHPRQCVFCMTTNDSEYLKDNTGNRRWLPVRLPEGRDADIEWLEKNREQLFAEAYARRDEPTWIHPKQAMEDAQEERRVTDEIERDVVDWYMNLPEEKKEYGVRIVDCFDAITARPGEERRQIIDKRTEWRITDVFKSALKLEARRKRQLGVNARFWFETKKTPKIADF